MNILSGIKKGITTGNYYLNKTANFLLTPMILLHEKCHAIAFSILFENVRTEIFFTDTGAKCRATFDGPPVLSKYGHLLGLKKSFALVSAAGPLGEMLLSVVLYRLFKENPLVSTIRCVHSSLIVGYALSVFEKPIEFFSGNYEKDTHDYRDLRLDGGLIAVHLLIGLAFINCKHSTYKFCDLVLTERNIKVIKSFFRQ